MVSREGGITWQNSDSASWSVVTSITRLTASSVVEAEAAPIELITGCDKGVEIICEKVPDCAPEIRVGSAKEADDAGNLLLYTSLTGRELLISQRARFQLILSETLWKDAMCAVLRTTSPR